MKIISGLAWHIYHDRLVEYCYDYEERREYIRKEKPLEEQELRLRLFKLIPINLLPEEIIKAEEAYIKAIEDIKDFFEKLHKELCPRCPWNGQTIFAEKKEQR